MSEYGSALAPKGDDNGKPLDPAWVTQLRSVTGADTTSSERLDVAKFILILLVCSGHFVEPFYKVGDRGVGAYMHAIYSFHVPAFVLISGYVSGDLNPKRRRALIAGTLAPFLIMHFIYSLWYTRTFCRGAWTHELGHPRCEFVNNWPLLDVGVGEWDSWGTWTFAYPFAQLWYLVSLFTKRVWRPFGLEFRWTILFHTVLGVLVGYTTIGRFLSIQRSVVHMPYFLGGFLMRKHRCFFPSAKTTGAKAAALGGLVFIQGIAILASFLGKPVEIWFQSDPHRDVYGRWWMYGAVFQLGLYVWTFFAMVPVFALFPEPDEVGVRYADGETLPLKAPAADAEGGGAAPAVAGSRGKYGRERDQGTLAATVYLRLAKWGARTLYPFVLHIAVMMLLARYTEWYDGTWTADGGPFAFCGRAVWTWLVALVCTVVFSLRPVVALFRWLLEPDISALFSPELQKV